MPSSHKSWIKLPFIVVLKNVEMNPCYSVINNNDQLLKIKNKTLLLFYLVACWLLRCFSLFHFFQAEKLQDISWFLYIVSVTDREYTDWYSWAISICLQLIQLINVKLTQQFWSSEYHLNCISHLCLCLLCSLLTSPCEMRESDSNTLPYIHFDTHSYSISIFCIKGHMKTQSLGD